MDIKRLLDVGELNKIALDKKDIREYSKYDSGFLFYMFEKEGIVPPKENVPLNTQGSITFFANNYELNKSDLNKIGQLLYQNNPLYQKLKQENSISFTKQEIEEILLNSSSTFPDVDVFLNLEDIEDLISNTPENYRYSTFKIDYLKSCVDSIPMSEVLASSPKVFCFLMNNHKFIESVVKSPELVNAFVDRILDFPEISLSISSFESLLNVGASPKLLEKISSYEIMNNIRDWEPKFKRNYPDFSINDVFFSLNSDHRLRIINEDPTYSFDYSILSNSDFYNYNQYLNEQEISQQILSKLPEDFKVFYKIKELAENQNILMEDVIGLSREVINLPKERLFPLTNNFVETVQAAIDSGYCSSKDAAYKAIGFVVDAAFKNNVLMNKPEDWIDEVFDDVANSLNKAIYLTLINKPLPEDLVKSLDISVLEDLKKLKLEPLPKYSKLFQEGFFGTDEPGYLNENLVYALGDEDIQKYLSQGFLIENKAFNKFKNITTKEYPSWLVKYVNKQRDSAPEFLKGCITKDHSSAFESLCSMDEPFGYFAHKKAIHGFIQQLDNKEILFGDVLNKIREINQSYVDGVSDENSRKITPTLLKTLDAFMEDSSGSFTHYAKLIEQENLRFHPDFIKNWVTNEKSPIQKDILRSYLERNLYREDFDVFSVNREMLFNYCKAGDVLNALRLDTQVKVMIWLLTDGEELQAKSSLVKSTKNDLLFQEMKNFIINEKPELVINKKFDFASWSFSVDEILDAYKNFNDKTGMSWTTNKNDNHGELLNYITTVLSSKKDGFSQYLDALENAKLQYPAFYLLLSDPNKVQSMFTLDIGDFKDLAVKVEVFKESAEGKSLVADNSGLAHNINWDLAYAFSLIDVDSYIEGVKDLRRTYGNFSANQDHTETFKEKSAFINDLQYLLYLEDDSVFYKSKEDVKIIFDKLIDQSIGNFYIFAERDKLINYIGKDYVIDTIVQKVNSVQDFNDLFLFTIASNENSETGKVNSFQLSPPSYILDGKFYQDMFDRVIDKKPEFRDYVIYLCEEVLPNSNYFTQEVNKSSLTSFIKVVNDSSKTISHLKASINNDFILSKINKVVENSSDDVYRSQSSGFKL